MELKELKKIIAKGEDSHHQFKENINNGDKLAAEMIAFSNANGGKIFLGIDKYCKITGLSLKDVERLNQLINNTASQHIRSPITVHTENITVNKDKIVIVVSIPKGVDKPYFDRNGVIWFRSGSDKRRINSKAELYRLFQSVAQLHADEMPTKASLDTLDMDRLKRFIETTYKHPFPKEKSELKKLLSNMNLFSDAETLNLAGLLLFAEHPEWIKPALIVKAVTYPGTTISVDNYVDSEDFSGPMEVVFNAALSFISRNLLKIQADQNINSLGKMEIPRVVFEELLVNALIHRDYFVNAPIRLFVFSDRIEIISPGHLPNHLTIEKIRTGNSNIRNPILASFVAKGLLPYRGLGSGVKRALEEWPEIDFIEDRDGCLFTVKVYRKSMKKWDKKHSRNQNESEYLKVQNTKKNAPINAPLSGFEDLKVQNTKENAPINAPLSELQEDILDVIRTHPEATYDEMEEKLKRNRTTIMRNVQHLKEKGILRRIGSKKTGTWEITE